MVTGIEAAGLALAAFPVVVEVVDWYSGSVTGRDVKFLAESLKNYERIFLNSVESLLRSIVTAAELRRLLDNLEGELWRDKSLNDKVVEHLGSEADGILEIANEIYKTVLELKKKLPTRDNINKDQSLLARAKKIVKCFVHGPRQKASLERLKLRITEFRMLAEGALRLAPSRCRLPRAMQDLNLIQECASGLYDALRNGWQCECDGLHPANIELDVWSRRSEVESDTICLKFSFLFADDAQHASSDHWMTAEIMPSDAIAHVTGPAALGCPSSSPSNQGLNPDPCSCAAAEPTNVCCSGTSTIIHSTSQSGSTPIRTQDSQDEEYELIHDLCTVLTKSQADPRPVRRRLGSISDSNGHHYRLFTRFDQLRPAPTRRSMRIVELFGQSSKMSNKNRVQVGLMLAWGVLQISSTSWLEGHWTKDNILLVIDHPNKPLPYVSHHFQSSRRNSHSSTLTPRRSNEITNWARNLPLFALAVFLLEICYYRSIEDLAQDIEMNEKGEPYALTSFLTATRLSHNVQNELGLKYAQAVKACLNLDCEMDESGRVTDKVQFAKSMMRYIIQPLEAVADSFGK